MKNFLRSFAALCGIVATIAPTFAAQEAVTDPIGVMNLTIPAAPNASSPSYSLLNIPLSDAAIYSGTLAAVGASTLTVNGTVTETFNAANPYFIKLVSGARAGRTFLITSNTGGNLTVDTQGSTLNALSPALATGATGDRYKIFAADTLLTVFGNQTLGSTTAANADQVWIWSPAAGVYNKYFYHTGNAQWQDTAFNLPSNSVVIRPDSGVMFVRKAISALTLQIPGFVPTTQTLLQIRDSGFTVVSPGFPIDTTILGLGLHTQAQWIKSTAAATADQLWVWVPASGTYNKYYYHSGNSRWQDTMFGLPANTTVVPAGTSLMIKKAAASGAGYSTYAANLPYTL